jgi:hypothetical protein
LDAWMISEKHDDLATENTRVLTGAPSRVGCPELEVDVTRSFGATVENDHFTRYSRRYDLNDRK